ncbi:SRPBCC domain-containing protein [Embleya sp. NPDC059237]|uniref:SRPBCC domain-containing protein n=1 Tax=Embleya sp. NPDC059237 TaxID=3346784 RepID=UPI00368C7097
MGTMKQAESVSVALTIALPAAKVFAVLTDPTTHASIDGTGWVQECVDRAPLTEVGQVFRMAMYHAKHPDGDYRMANQVRVLDAPHAIGWAPGMEQDDGGLQFGGWTWRYDLKPLDASQTEVTLTYDWSAASEPARERFQFPPFGPEHLPNSLRHLAEIAAAR